MEERLPAALAAGEPLDGFALVRADGSVVDVADATPRVPVSTSPRNVELAFARHHGLS